MSSTRKKTTSMASSRDILNVRDVKAIVGGAGGWPAKGRWEKEKEKENGFRIRLTLGYALTAAAFGEAHAPRTLIVPEPAAAVDGKAGVLCSIFNKVKHKSTDTAIGVAALS